MISLIFYIKVWYVRLAVSSSNVQSFVLTGDNTKDCVDIGVVETHSYLAWRPLFFFFAIILALRFRFWYLRIQMLQLI